MRLYYFSPAISLAYDPLNRLTNLVDGLGATYYGYDTAGRLASEDGPWNDDTVSYVYSNGRRIAMNLQEPNAAPWSQTYAYDAARRLTNTASPAGAFGYRYQPSTLISQLLLPNGAYITNTYDSVKGSPISVSGQV